MGKETEDIGLRVFWQIGGGKIELANYGVMAHSSYHVANIIKELSLCVLGHAVINAANMLKNLKVFVVLG